MTPIIQFYAPKHRRKRGFYHADKHLNEIFVKEWKKSRKKHTLMIRFRIGPPIIDYPILISNYP